MIGIGRQTDYGVRIVMHLACLPPDSRVTLASVADQRLLPVPFVRRLVGQLVSAGILVSARGFNGGISLAKPASEITLLDVVQALEGEVGLNLCVDHDEACPFADACPVRTAWTGATRLMGAHLAGIRFSDLASAATGHVEAHAAARSQQSFRLAADSIQNEPSC